MAGLQTMYKPHESLHLSHDNINLQKRSHEGFKAWVVEPGYMGNPIPKASFCRKPFSYSLQQRPIKNPLFEAISLLVPTGPLKNRSKSGLNAYFSKAIAIIYNPKGYEITASINLAECPKTKCSIH
jgi:hypothetical protein